MTSQYNYNFSDKKLYNGDQEILDLNQVVSLEPYYSDEFDQWRVIIKLKEDNIHMSLNVRDVQQAEELTERITAFINNDSASQVFEVKNIWRRRVQFTISKEWLEDEGWAELPDLFAEQQFTITDARYDPNVNCYKYTGISPLYNECAEGEWPTNIFLHRSNIDDYRNRGQETIRQGQLHENANREADRS